MLTLPQRLRALRQERGLTQTQVGQALGVGKMTVSQLEKGQVALTPTKLAKLAQLYGLSVDALSAFQPAPVASQQIQVVEHLLARLAAVERELQQKDQTLTEMRSFFSELNHLLRDAASPSTVADKRLHALTELIRKFGQSHEVVDGRPVRGKRSAANSKQEPKEFGEQLLQVILRGIGLSFLVRLQQGVNLLPQSFSPPVEPTPNKPKFSAKSIPPSQPTRIKK